MKVYPCHDRCPPVRRYFYTQEVEISPEQKSLIDKSSWEDYREWSLQMLGESKRNVFFLYMADLFEEPSIPWGSPESGKDAFWHMDRDPNWI